MPHATEILPLPLPVDPAVVRPRVLGLESFLRLGLPISQPQFLEKDIGSVVHTRRIPRQRPFFRLKVLEQLRLQFLRFGEHVTDFAQEAGLRDVGVAQVRGDFAAHVVGFFAVKMDAGDIEFLALVGLLDSFLWDFAHAARLAFLEEAEGGFVGLVHGAAGGAFEFHEAAVGVAVDVDGAEEFRHFHFAAVEEGGDFAADDIAVVGDEDFAIGVEGGF